MNPKKRKAQRAKLSRKGIAQAGFVEVRPGVFEKPQTQARVPLRDTEPPASRMERVPPERDQGKARDQRKGETRNQSGVRYQLVIISYRPRPIDHGNCIGKYIEDFLVEQELMPDDNVFHCEPPVIRQVIVPEKDQRTEVFLYQLIP